MVFTCDACIKFTRWVSVAFKEELNTFVHDRKPPEILESAQECAFCELIASYLDEDFSVSLVPIEFSLQRDDAGLICAARLSLSNYEKYFSVIFAIHCLEGGLPPPLHSLNLTCNLGSRAHRAGRFSSFRPIPADDSAQTWALARGWLGDCLRHHIECRRSIAGDLIDDSWPLLPTRIIDVGSSSSPIVRLLESDGLRSSYCALSYCWGPAGKSQLQTLEANLTAHLKYIPFGQVTRTIQDAITVVRSLRFRYLWVDALCIIQDNRQDWLRESKSMGAIYQNARLIISARGAEDSSTGCFVSERSPLQPVQLLFHTDDGSTESDSLYITRHTARDAVKKPLNDRAWAFQERIFARRLLHFDRNGLQWECKKTIKNERNMKLYPSKLSGRDPTDDIEWASLLSSYTAKSLTYSTDRLVALEGIVTEVQRSRHDLGQFYMGMWTGRFLQELLWTVRSRDGMQGQPELPSWTWVSKPGRKSFFASVMAMMERQPDVRPNAAWEFALDSSTLMLRSRLKHCAIGNDQCQVHDPGMLPFTSAAIRSAEMMMIYRGGGTFRFILPRRMSFVQPLSVVGFAVMDDVERIFGEVSCAVVLEGKRLEQDPMTDVGGHPWAALGEYTGPSLDLIGLNGRSRTFHWVLILQPLLGRSNHYKRIGMGVVWTNSWVDEGDIVEEAFYVR